MSDLIDREALLRQIDIDSDGEPGYYGDTWKFIDTIKRMPSALGTNLAEVGTDLISRAKAIEALSTITVYKGSIPYNTAVMRIKQLPSVQPERTCVNCGRTMNNGGWYADGRTRCPIEEHYALPKDGFCHLWEKRNITDDDYPERREK